MGGGGAGPGYAALRRSPLRRYSLRNFSLPSDAPTRVAAEAAGGRFVDLAPATEGARATSDGVHYLTAVNLVKARIFIALLHMSHDI